MKGLIFFIIATFLLYNGRTFLFCTCGKCFMFSWKTSTIFEENLQNVSRFSETAPACTIFLVWESFHKTRTTWAWIILTDGNASVSCLLFHHFSTIQCQSTGVNHDSFGNSIQFYSFQCSKHWVINIIQDQLNLDWFFRKISSGYKRWFCGHLSMKRTNENLIYNWVSPFLVFRDWRSDLATLTHESNPFQEEITQRALSHFQTPYTGKYSITTSKSYF